MATPRWLLEGVPQSAWQSGDVLAGMFFGWLNDNHAVTAQFTLGKGKVLVTTFDPGHYADDPFTRQPVQRAAFVSGQRRVPAPDAARIGPVGPVGP